jgi:hypothetical protein
MTNIPDTHISEYLIEAEVVVQDFNGVTVEDDDNLSAKLFLPVRME